MDEFLKIEKFSKTLENSGIEKFYVLIAYVFASLWIESFLNIFKISNFG